MNSRIAHKIANGHGVVPGPAKWTREQYDAAHRIVARRALRRHRLRGSLHVAGSALAIVGGWYLTAGEDSGPIYMQDTGTERWMLPILKTAAQERAVAGLARARGIVPTGKKVIVDAVAFLGSTERTFRDRPIVFAVDFRMRGESIDHTTVAFS